MIEIKNIVYSVKKKEILHGINLNVEKGDCMALLGPNGAGKSSLIDIVSNLLKPDRGQVFINGVNYENVKSEVGILFEYTPYFYCVTVKEWIKYLCSIYRLEFKSLEKRASILKLSDLWSKQLQTLSKGERRRVSILASLLHNPPILILDEPTPDLDPFMQDAVWQLFKESNRTILFTTHLWDEAKNYAGKVAFIDKGNILATGRINEFFSKKYLPYDQKIVTRKENITDSDLNGVYHIVDDDIIHLYPLDISATSISLSQRSVEYSIVDTGLKDVYMLLNK